MNSVIGDTAGRIWYLIYSRGESTAIEIKSELEISNTLLYLALGWLMREGKVEVAEAEHTLKVMLKK